MPHGFLLHHLISLTPSSLSERLARLVSTFRLVCFRLAEGCVLRDLLDRRLRRLAVYDDFQTIILVPARAPWRKPAVQLVVFLLGGAQRHRPLRPKNPICFGSLHHFRESNLQFKFLIEKFRHKQWGVSPRLPPPVVKWVFDTQLFASSSRGRGNI